MKQVGKTITKWAIPAGILTLGTISVIATGAGSDSSKRADSKVGANAPESRATTSPAPDASPAITVNGVEIPTNSAGARDITIPGGKAHVEVSGGHTNVTANTSVSSGDTSNKQSSKVNINIDSQSINTSSNSSSSSQSSGSNHTNVFSTGDMDVDITD